MLSIFLKSLRDIFSFDVIMFIVKIVISSTILMAILFWLFWDDFSNLISYLVALIPFIGDFSFVQSATSFIGALIVAYGVILSLISILTSIYSPRLILKLAYKNYKIKGKDNSNVTKSILINIKASLLFLILLILFLPLIFVPIVGQIILLILWAILLKEPTLYDVSSLFIKNNNINFKDITLWIIAIVAALFNYIPFLNLFSAIFAQILFMHWILNKIAK